MSLVAASLMKSSVLGAMPSAELTPVCSPIDCAKAAKLSAVTSAADRISFFITAPLSSFGVDRADGQFRERVVRLLFLRQRLIEKFDRILVTQLISPGFQGAIARNLVMLDRLSRCQKSRVECRSISVLVHDFLAFVEDALDGIALLAARRLAEKLKDVFEALDVPFGFVVMLRKSVP